MVLLLLGCFNPAALNIEFSVPVGTSADLWRPTGMKKSKSEWTYLKCREPFLIFQPLDSNNLYNSENFTIADLLLEQCKGNDYVLNNKIYSVKMNRICSFLIVIFCAVILHSSCACKVVQSVERTHDTLIV